MAGSAVYVSGQPTAGNMLMAFVSA